MWLQSILLAFLIITETHFGVPCRYFSVVLMSGIKNDFSLNYSLAGHLSPSVIVMKNVFRFIGSFVQRIESRAEPVVSLFRVTVDGSDPICGSYARNGAVAK